MTAAVDGSRRRRLVARGQQLQARAIDAAARVPGFGLAIQAVNRDHRSGGGLLAGALAFRLFGALLPLGLLVAVGLGYAQTVDPNSAEEIGHAAGISSALMTSISESSKLSTGTRWTVEVFTALALLWSASSAARAIRASHSLAWDGRVSRLGRAVPAGVVLIGALIAFALVWAAVGRARAELGRPGLLVAFVAIVPFFFIWMGVAHLLPHGRAPWRALVPGAVLVAIGMQLVHLGSVLFVAGRVERASETYGSFGVAFTTLAWLYIVSRVIVASAMLNAALWERERLRAPVAVPTSAAEPASRTTTGG